MYIINIKIIFNQSTVLVSIDKTNNGHILTGEVTTYTIALFNFVIILMVGAFNTDFITNPSGTLHELPQIILSDGQCLLNRSKMPKHLLAYLY